MSSCFLWASAFNNVLCLSAQSHLFTTTRTKSYGFKLQLRLIPSITSSFVSRILFMHAEYAIRVVDSRRTAQINRVESWVLGLNMFFYKRKLACESPWAGVAATCLITLDDRKVHMVLLLPENRSVVLDEINSWRN